jgi:hypothetical protein
MGEKKKPAIRLNKPDDIRRLIARTINELKNDEMTEGKAKAIGYLCRVLLDAIETTEIDARLQKLEEKI